MSRELNRREFIARGTATAGLAAASLRSPAGAEASATDAWGELTGRFLYDGTPPQRKRLKVDKDVDCCGKFDIRDESLMVGENGGLGNVYVYVRTRGVAVCPDLAQSVEKEVLLDNRDCIFMPHCMKIWCAEQVFHIVNSDPVAQNVAFSPLGDRPANIILPPLPAAAAEATWTFKRKQNVPVPIACNYHPWESAFVLPRDNPYVDVTKMDGTFRIPKLPAGKLEFQLWHEKVGYLRTPRWSSGRFTVAVKPGINDLGTIRIDPAWLVKR